MAEAPRVRRSWATWACKALAGLRRLPVTPQLVDQTIGADRVPSVQRQESQESPLLGAANGSRHTPSDHLELAEELHFHAPTVRPMTGRGVIEPTRLPEVHLSGTSGTEPKSWPRRPRTSGKGSTHLPGQPCA